MANKIQLRRDTSANWTRVNPVLDDGEPGLEIDTNKVKYGDGNTAWNILSYASGGLTDVDGVVTFPGNFLIGTLWPNDPIDGMGGDKESVVWAKDDTEYLGLWWGGDQTYPDPGYGPVAGIMIGPNDDGSLTDDFTHNASPVGTNITVAINDSNGDTLEWRFDRDGIFTLSDGGYIDNNGGITRLGAGGNLGVQIGSSDTQNYVTASNVGVTIQTLADSTNSNWIFGTDGILTMPPGNETTAGWIQWSHASDDLTNVAGAGFIDYFNAYTGLGLTAPTNTNAEKGIWFGTPADPTSPFQPETSMVFRNDTLYLPKNGFIKSHDINRVGYANLTTVGTNVTIQTNDEYDWTFGADGILTLPDGGYVDNNGGITRLSAAGAAGAQIGSSDTQNYVTASNVGVTIQTLADSTNSNWIFGTDGNLTIPGEIKSATTTGPVVVQSNDGNNTYTWTFETSGALVLPTISGNEGAEIDFTKAPNSTLSGNVVIVDQYVDRIRFFEGGGTARGAYIDLKQAAAGVGTLLNNRVSAFVNAGIFVTMDNIQATVTTSSNRGLSLATVSGTATCFISGTYGGGATAGGASAGVALTTTPSVSMFDWDFASEGDAATYVLNDGYTKSYRITMMIGASFNNNMISIERLI